MHISTELMETLTHLCGLCLSAAVFELRADEHDGVLHRAEQSANISAVQVTGGQDGLRRGENRLSRLQEARGRIEKTVWIHTCTNV